MKKIKILTTLSCLGVFATAAPIVVTSCSEDDQPKGLEIQIEGEDTVTADGGQITWNVRATYDRRSVEIKELEATVQDSNVATVEKQGNDKIIITGKTPDSTNIHIKITDSENRTTEKDFSVNVIGDVVLNVISGEGYSVVDKTITISKDAEPSADVNVNLEFDFALKSSFDASTALESTITGITFQNGSTPGKNVIMVIPIAVWTQMLPITYELKISTKQGYSGVSINSLTLSLKKENYYSFDSATPSISTSFVPSTPMMETYTKGASIWNGVINNATLQFSVSFTVSTWKACKINTATRVSEEITSTSTGVQFANGTFTVETAPTSWTFETLYTVTAIDDNGKSAQMAFMLWPTSTTIGVTTTGTPQDV
ncbi:MAG: hypothetical protein HUJ52_03390, partial [Malacoplasma sp.]|nr:hypothetical protein [Malacoplasma sp.]